MLHGTCWHSISKCRICLFVPIFPKNELLKAGLQWNLKVERWCPPCFGSASAPSWMACAGEFLKLVAFCFSRFSFVLVSTYVGLSSPAWIAAVFACSSVRPKTTWCVEYIELIHTHLMLLLLHLHCANCLLQATLQVPSRPAAGLYIFSFLQWSHSKNY